MPKPEARAHVRKANAAYEAWLRAQLAGEIVQRDLRKKWKKMSDGAFPFLRATYWRWAETILDICPELAGAPAVLAVGDIHLENFGVWRDADGRLVWGVNDFDEAAEMPYALDLVRLAASATLARRPRSLAAESICGAILAGYRKGLENPRPFVLDEEHPWLRKLLVVSEQERARFWNKMDKLTHSKTPPTRYRRTIEAAMPDGTAVIEKFAPRDAGTGSLGRPRWVGIAQWRGGPLVREAKALVPSGWTRVAGRGSRKLRCQEIAFGRYRAPDPWLAVNGAVVVRRLSPNSRKIEVEKRRNDLLNPRMLQAMGHELASVHLGTGDRARAVKNDLARRKSEWLGKAAAAAAAFVTGEFKEWNGR